MRRAAAAVTACLVLASAGCSSAPTVEYGASADAGASAGPDPDPSSATTAPAAAEPAEVATAARPLTGPELCRSIRRAEAARQLGRPVGPVEVSRLGGATRCSWDALTMPPVPSWRQEDPANDWARGRLTITRGPASEYTAIVREISQQADQHKARAVHTLPHLGTGAFVVGASVSGLPFWQGVRRHEDLVTSVLISGDGTSSSLAHVQQVLEDLTTS